MNKAGDFLKGRRPGPFPRGAGPKAPAAEADGRRQLHRRRAFAWPGGSSPLHGSALTVPAGRGSETTVNRVTRQITLLGDAPDGRTVPTVIVEGGPGMMPGPDRRHADVQLRGGVRRDRPETPPARWRVRRSSGRRLRPRQLDRLTRHRAGGV